MGERVDRDMRRERVLLVVGLMVLSGLLWMFCAHRVDRSHASVADSRERAASAPGFKRKHLIRGVAREMKPWAVDFAPRLRHLLSLPEVGGTIATSPAEIRHCSKNCSGHGACHLERGSYDWLPRCLCKPGWKGTLCTTTMPLAHNGSALDT